MLDSIGDEGGALKHDLIRAVRLALEQCRMQESDTTVPSSLVQTDGPLKQKQGKMNSSYLSKTNTTTDIVEAREMIVLVELVLMES